MNINTFIDNFEVGGGEHLLFYRTRKPKYIFNVGSYFEKLFRIIETFGRKRKII